MWRKLQIWLLLGEVEKKVLKVIELWWIILLKWDEKEKKSYQK